MRKDFLFVLTVASFLFLFAGCSQTTPQKEDIISNQSDTSSNESINDSQKSQNTDDEFEDFDEMEDDDDEFGDFDDEIVENPEDEVYDPFEGYNRGMTDFNDGLYIYLLDPVASGYAYVVPEGGRRSVNNFLENLLFPVRFVNNVLQAKFSCAGTETLRFVINCTIGILGLFDPAEDWFGIKPCVEDFGQTLGFWGVGAGPHFVIPFLGPSNLRDMFSLYPDSFYDPISQIDPLERQVLFRAYKAVNYTSLHLGEYESLKRDAFDYYLFFRDAYEQHRKKLIEE